MMQRAYPYLRVSTKRQGKSGLGLDAQEESIKQFAQRNGYKLGHPFVEVESGRNSNRPQLTAALSLCKKQKATLLIATLDRLARNVLFIATLIASKTRFVVVDQPKASKFVLHIQAAVAEEESDKTSERTHAALQAAKRRGVKLGTACQELALKNKLLSIAFTEKMIPVFVALIAEGFTTVRALAKELNRRHIPTFRGHDAKWHRKTVWQILRRSKENNLSLQQ